MNLFSIVAEDSPDILARITNHITGKGIEIKSIASGPAEKRGMVRITLVTEISIESASVLKNSLEQLISVISVKPLCSKSFVARQFAILKVKLFSGEYHNAMEVVKSFGGRIVKKGKDLIIIELIDEAAKIQSVINTLNSFGVVESAQSGIVAI